MELAILAQNIHTLSLALVEDCQVKKMVEVPVPPEQYLSAIDQTLREWGAELKELSKVVVVTGPGSFTASRVSTTIANTIGFVQGISVAGIENPGNLSLGELLSSGRVNQDSVPFTLPTYSRPPNITQAKK
mgnify:CR=1 FL=1